MEVNVLLSIPGWSGTLPARSGRVYFFGHKPFVDENRLSGYKCPDGVVSAIDYL